MKWTLGVIRVFVGMGRKSKSIETESHRGNKKMCCAIVLWGDCRKKNIMGTSNSLKKSILVLLLSIGELIDNLF